MQGKIMRLNKAARLLIAVLRLNVITRLVVLSCISAGAVAAFSVASKSPATQVAPEVRDEESWDVRLGQLRFVNAPMSLVLRFLRNDPVRVCWEIPADAVPGNFVDADGVLAWNDDQPITVDLSGLKISEAMDRLTKADPRYSWKRVPGTSIINIIPIKSKLA